MCGVIGLVVAHPRDDLGVVAGELLETLQYRGYDSTGAVIQGDSEESVTLRKGVGAPSTLIHSLGIVELGGRVFCGQVRWATFGVVDEVNAQPHVVRCKTHLYGAHNGNVTNCDALKVWLTERGHDVKSDNDGEMVVHLVEHHFAEQLERGLARSTALRRATVAASHELEGSFAAVVVDPVTRALVAIKRGSSLYFGIGDGEHGPFAIASSDLSSVLKQTKVLVPLAEGEAIFYTATDYEVVRLDGDEGTVLAREPLRSRLRVEDAVLQPSFRTFMEQEIHAQPETVRDALRMFQGGSTRARAMAEAETGWPASEVAELDRVLAELRGEYADDDLVRSVRALAATATAPDLTRIGSLDQTTPLSSEERAVLSDLIQLVPEHEALLRGVDAYIEASEVNELVGGVEETTARMQRALDAGNRIYLVCCGTSYHAAKAASTFFGELAHAEVIPLLPGEFRAQYARTFTDGDILVGVSQSGETKDLLDIVDLVRRSEKDVSIVGVVNNLNSTLAQEKSDVVVPLHCGPEIAVPATKSFLNQLTVFYGLARRLGEARGLPERPLPDLPALVRRTLEETAPSIARAAELAYLAPSMHLLATRLLAVAKEGALKVREVVLNHTEGFEASEFKHGPNTILGFNTVFGVAQVQALLDALAKDIEEGGDDRARAAELVRRGLETTVDALYADYPLVFITGPDARDIDLTISQINTHKIRGASTIVIAEEDSRLRATAERPPAGRDDYRAVYVTLPQTGDTLMSTFSASVALQLLALRMSEKKLAHLESLGIRDHGVHPDAPKNVSKSITVD